MHRGIKLAGIALMLGSGVALAACSSSSGANQVAATCKGGYPDAGGIKNMSPYSPNAGSFTPPCAPRG